MSDDKREPWTLQDHLRVGAEAIEAISRDNRPRPAKVCHHFSPGDHVDDHRLTFEEGYAEDLYAALVPIFNELGLDFILRPLESWETCEPSIEWLEKRIPTIFDLAETHGSILSYDGWTWEPRGGQPIGACSFDVINNRSTLSKLR
jgi:hypothetical protein